MEKKKKKKRKKKKALVKETSLALKNIEHH